MSCCGGKTPMTNLPAPNSPFSAGALRTQTAVSEDTHVYLEYIGPQPNLVPLHGPSGGTYFFKHGMKKWVLKRDATDFLTRRHGKGFLFRQVDPETGEALESQTADATLAPSVSTYSTSGEGSQTDLAKEDGEDKAENDSETADEVTPPLSVTITHHAQSAIDALGLTEDQVQQLLEKGGSGSNGAIVKSDVEQFAEELNADE